MNYIMRSTVFRLIMLAAIAGTQLNAHAQTDMDALMMGKNNFLYRLYSRQQQLEKLLGRNTKKRQSEFRNSRFNYDWYHGQLWYQG